MFPIRIWNVRMLFVLIFCSKKAILKIIQDKPHIIIIIGDDVGWNDYSLHGSNQIPTPNIDALGYNGIILHRHYTQSTCTPSRAALLTGKYPMRLGLQGRPIGAGENKSIPENVTILPAYLKKLGYLTHLVGKWHLGAAKIRDTPIGKGFDTHFGYWNGFIGYFNHFHWKILPRGIVYKGLDLRDQFKPAWNVSGRYITDLFTEKSCDIIETHNPEQPLFLVVSHLAAHTGFDGYELGVPNLTDTNLKYSYIEDERRRQYAEIVNRLDDSVGEIVKKLDEKDMLHNSIVLFLSDNGAPVVGKFLNSGSNWPLRGSKHFYFEGGVRNTAVIFSPFLNKKSYISNHLIHISDWLPTLYTAAGGTLKNLGKIDGIDQWSTLSNALKTKRDELLLELSEVGGYSAIISSKGRYKFINGSGLQSFSSNYYGDNGRSAKIPPYDVKSVILSKANKAIKKIISKELDQQKILNLRFEIDLSTCRDPEFTPDISCSHNSGCLFDLDVDPCETKNIIYEIPEQSEKLWARIKEFQAEAVPEIKLKFDPRANPIYYNNTWCTWLDDKSCDKTPSLSTTFLSL